MRQGVGNRQQQAVSSRQRSGQTARGNHAGHHVRQATDFRRGQHDDVATDRDFGQLQDAVLVHVNHGQEAGIDRAPTRNPLRQVGKGRVHQHGVDLELGQNGQRRRREVEQEDEEQRPAHRFAGFTHRWHGVVAHQNVRQSCRTNHQTEDQRHEVLAGDVPGGIVFAGEWLGVTNRRVRARSIGSPCRGVSSAGGSLVLRQLAHSSFSRLDICQTAIGCFELFHFFLCSSFVSGHGSRHVLEFFNGGVRACLENTAHFQLFRIFQQLLFFGTHFFKCVAIDSLRNRHAGVFHRQPNDGQQVGNDQDDVLGNLCPGHGTHTAQERANQNTDQTGKNTHFKSQTRQTRGDQANAVNLCHHIGEGAQDGGKHTDQAGQIALVAGAQKVRNGELAELAQVGRQEKRHQAITTGPSQNKSQTAITREVQRASHADEGGCRHPVSARGHTVVQSRNSPTCHIVFSGVIGATHHADAGIKKHCGRQERVADPSSGHAHLLKNSQQDHEREKASGVPGVDLVQALFKFALRLFFISKHYSSPSDTPYSMSSLFM